MKSQKIQCVHVEKYKMEIETLDADLKQLYM